MFTIFIVLLVVALVVAVIGFMEGVSEGLSVILIAIFVLILPFMGSFRWQIGEENYSGYIYSRESKFGYTTYHIRFSQNAGEDKQPSFSVKAGSEEEKKFDALVGQDKKVQVFLPSTDPKFVQNIFEPASLAVLKEVEEVK